MKSISNIRSGLRRIHGALVDLPPDTGAHGDEPGVITETMWHPDENDAQLEPARPLPLEPDDDPLSDGDGEDFDPVFELASDAEAKIAALGQGSEEQIRKSLEIHGTDALGYYSSFHYTGQQWGAYVTLSGIVYLARSALGALDTSEGTKFRLAFHAILQHELFHFAADYATAQAELSQCQAWWVPAKQQARELPPGYLGKEEMIANAWMLKSFRTAIPDFRVRGKQDALKAFVKGQGEGYRDALRIRSTADWRAELQALSQTYSALSGHGDSNPLLWTFDGFDWPATYPITPRIDWRRCAIHLVDDSQRYGVPPGWLTHFAKLDDIRESDQFFRDLKRMSPQVRSAWARTKHRLQAAITPGHDFKRFQRDGANVYSARVNDSVRVHLQRDPTGLWIALGIGGHKEMGHG